MNAEQFFHVCRSAAAIANTPEVTAFGAAAIVPWADEVAGAVPWPSLEVDLDMGATLATDLVDGSIGDGSLFAETFGVYAQGVGIEAFVAPADWGSRARMFVEPVSGVNVRVPHPVDLTVAKLVRGDPRDWAFAEYTAKHFGLTVERLTAGLQSVIDTRPDYTAPATAAKAAVAARFRSETSKQ